MNQHQEVLDQRLKEFRRKYYVDRILRGSLLLGLVVSSILFVVLLSEGIFGFSSPVRKGIVIGLGLLFTGILGYMVLWPLAQLLNLTRNLSDFQIATMVRDLFPDINDKLLNLLQLKREAGNADLAAAAVAQKAAEIAPVRLSNAINLKLNRRYLWLLLIPLGLFFLTYVSDPQLLGASSYRLINYDQSFLPPPPFRIIIEEFPQEIVAGESVPLRVRVEGDQLPAELFVFIRDDSDPDNEYVDFSLDRTAPTAFSYTLSDLKNDFSLFVANPEVRSDTLAVAVLRRPFIKNFQVRIDYPAYTNLPSETLDDNVGDFKVLKGARVSWQLRPQGDVQQAWLVPAEGSPQAFEMDESGTLYRTSRRMMEDLSYHIGLTSDENISNIDTVRYQVNLLQDRYPSLYIFGPNQDFTVDLDPVLPLDMEVADDFGFSRMAFFYRFTKSGGASGIDNTFRAYELPIDARTLLQAMSTSLDLTRFGFSEGDEIEYYVKVWDNDGVSGPKATTSATFRVVYPTLDARYDELAQNREEVEEDLAEIKQTAEELKEAYRKMQEKLLEQRQLSFDDRREVQRMIEEHRKMLEQLEQAQERFEETKEQLQENEMISEETLQKYEELNRFMEELDNPEIEKMLEELAERLENLTPEEIREKMEQLQMNDEDLRKSLERTLELLKQLEVQEKIDEIRNKLDNLEAKQRMLEEKTEQAEEASELEDLAERQEALQEQLDAIREDMEQLAEMKENTNTPDSEQMEDLQEAADSAAEEMQEAQDKMEQAQEQMQEGGRKNKKEAGQMQQDASQSQQNAADQMQEMSDKLSQMQMDMQSQQDAENLENLRTLLENLLKLSFDQEDLKDEVRNLKYGDPALKEKSQEQKKLQDDMGLVRDSLEALANRVFQIQKFVLDESQLITQSMAQSQEFFRSKQIPRITANQQQAMTSINNLANMLSEVMQQIQQQMMNAQAGGQMCKKPNGQKPNMQGLPQQQQELNEAMRQMMQGKMTPEQMAEMAARQEAIRKQLQEAQERMEQEGGSALGDLDKIQQDMQQTETDLINKQLTHETMLRQQQILNRLLQAEQAMREQDLDDERESRTAREMERLSPEELSLEEYKNRIRQELLKTNKLDYSNDFIILIEQYFKKLEGANE